MWRCVNNIVSNVRPPVLVGLVGTAAADSPVRIPVALLRAQPGIS